MPPTPRSARPELRPLEQGDPATVGPFTVVGRLGAGGMGVVYGALDGDHRCVAVKVITPKAARNPQYRQLFAQEAALLARIDAECVPRFLGADPEAPLPWLATEFVPGRTLKQNEQPLTGDTLTAFAAGTAEALAALHAAGVVHLDITPANIMLSPDGPRVLDFGLARPIEAATGHGYGTAGWISPERLAGAPGGPAADMFAWGGLVAYAATGRPPFGTGSSQELRERVSAGDFAIDGVPEELRGLVERALSVDPAARPTAVEAFDTVLGIRADAADRARRERLRALLDRAWTGFDAAGHRSATWVAIAGSLALATSSGVADGTATANRASGAAAEGTAPRGSAVRAARAGRGLLAVAAAVTVLAVAAGAWTLGRVATDQPVLPLAGPESEPTGAADPTPAPPGQTVEYRGLELAFPADWTITTVEDVTFEDIQDPSAGQVVDDFLIAWPPEQAGCADIDWAQEWWWRERDCVHAKILGPGAIRFTGTIDSTSFSDRSITEDDDRGMFFPGTQGGLPCPSADGANPYGGNGEEYVPAEDLEPVDPGNPPPPLATSERTTVHGRDAVYREYRIFCIDHTSGREHLGYANASFGQRSWLLPEAEILVVDEYGIPGLDEVMAS